MITTYLFDLDGTLIDSGFYAKQYEPMMSKIASHIGTTRVELDNRVKSLKKTDGRYDTGEVARFLGILDFYYREQTVPPLRQEAREVLSQLEGRRIGIVTNSMNRTVEQYLKTWGIKVSFIFTAEDAGVPKSSDMFWQAVMQKKQLMAHSTLVIGDNAIEDIMRPKRLGFRTVHVLKAADLRMVLKQR
jgi:FMN phosphatase YigB (HAD superfamily)